MVMLFKLVKPLREQSLVARNPDTRIWEYSGTPSVTAFPLTLSCWVNDAANDNTSRSFLALCDTSTGAGFYLYGYGDINRRFNAYVRNTSSVNSRAVGSTFRNQNQWFHVCAVFESDSYKAIYVNGILEGTQLGTFPMDGTINSLRVGVDYNNANDSDSNQYQPAIWNTVLSEAEILQLAQGANPQDIRRESLKHYMEFDASISNGAWFDKITGLPFDNSGSGDTAYINEVLPPIQTTTPKFNYTVFNDTLTILQVAHLSNNKVNANLGTYTVSNLNPQSGASNRVLIIRNADVSTATHGIVSVTWAGLDVTSNLELLIDQDGTTVSVAAWVLRDAYFPSNSGDFVIQFSSSRGRILSFDIFADVDQSQVFYTDTAVGISNTILIENIPRTLGDKTIPFISTLYDVNNTDIIFNSDWSEQFDEFRNIQSRGAFAISTNNSSLLQISYTASASYVVGIIQIKSASTLPPGQGIYTPGHFLTFML